MIVNADAKALEWVVGTYLSKDKIAKEEILNQEDQHSKNQKAFGLPSRLIAKKFVFRLMYGGSAYAYANDPDFSETSTSEKFWQRVIDKFYQKYYGFAEWHTSIVKTACETGQLVMPTGRIYTFELVKDYRGDLKAPETTIKNYPVQGLGADVMAIARVSFAKRFHKEKIDGLLVNTVHDSIVCDVAKHEVPRTARLFHEVFRDIPRNFERLFGVPFDLPLLCECSAGPNMKETVDIPV